MTTERLSATDLLTGSTPLSGPSPCEAFVEWTHSLADLSLQLAEMRGPAYESHGADSPAARADAVLRALEDEVKRLRRVLRAAGIR